MLNLKKSFLDREIFLYSDAGKKSNSSIFYKVKNVDTIQLANFFKQYSEEPTSKKFVHEVLQNPPMMCYKKGASLQKLLVQAKI